MTAITPNEFCVALAAGRSMAPRSDGPVLHAASPEVEAKLSRLVAMAVGMFAFSMTAIVGVGVMIF